MTDTEHEGQPDEAQESPVSPETFLDDEQAEEEGEAAETGADEPREGETEGDDGTEQERLALERREQRASEKAIEKMFSAFTREHDRHTKRIAEIAGDDATDLIECPACKADDGQPPIAGWLLPMPISEDKAIALRALIGLPDVPAMKPDPYTRGCETCDGLGVTLTGSHAANQEVITCHDCGAKGWVPTGPERGKVLTQNGAHEGADVVPIVPAQVGPEAPEVAALRQQGYTIIPPLVVPQG